MEHMVKKGYIVVWVEFQFRTLPSRYDNHALETFRDALNRLQTAIGLVVPSVSAQDSRCLELEAWFAATRRGQSHFVS
jgi:hypothetical protein